MKQEFISPTLKNSTIHIHNGLYAEEERFVDWHFHDEIEFLWIREHEKEIYIHHTLYKLYKDDIIFINERIPHKTYTPKGNSTFLLQCMPMRIDEEHLGFTRRPLHLNNFVPFFIFRAGSELNEIFRNCFFRALTEYTQQKKSYEHFLKAIVSEIVANLYRYELLNEPEALYSFKNIERLLPVLDYVEAHYADSITLDEMSTLINVEHSYFCRLFKKTMNISFMEYLYLVRFSHAENLLLNSDKNITEIAYEVGFSSPAYFTKMFRERKGYTPTFYKKLQKR
jgi:AraC-like DNA-binding protein